MTSRLAPAQPRTAPVWARNTRRDGRDADPSDPGDWITAAESADCLDVEKGDATIAQAPPWLQSPKAKSANTLKPVLYTSLAQAEELVHACAAAGIPRSGYLLWLAHWTKTPHVCGPECGLGFTGHADATQYDDRALGKNLDVSLVRGGRIPRTRETWLGRPLGNFFRVRGEYDFDGALNEVTPFSAAWRTPSSYQTSPATTTSQMGLDVRFPPFVCFEVLIEQLQRDGEARAQMIRSDADRRAAESIAVAKGKATEIRGKGEVEAAKSLSTFQQNPELASFFFRLTALEESLKDRSTLIFDQGNVPFDLFRGVTTNLMTK
jgi:hypothetical protein